MRIFQNLQGSFKRSRHQHPLLRACEAGDLPRLRLLVQKHSRDVDVVEEVRPQQLHARRAHATQPGQHVSGSVSWHRQMHGLAWIVLVNIMQHGLVLALQVLLQLHL